MLFQIEIANFYSIREPQVIDLRPPRNVPAEPGRLPPAWHGSEERAPTVVAIFGPNASGKSNVLRALTFIAWFLRDSFRLDPEAPLPFECFRDNESGQMPTRLAIGLGGPVDLTAEPSDDAAECPYFYEVTFGPGTRGACVAAESLHYTPPGARRRRLLFRRVGQQVTATGSAFGLAAGQRDVLENSLRPNASLISTLAWFNHQFALAARMAAASVHSNIMLDRIEISDDAAAGYYAGNNPRLKRLNSAIRTLDLGIRGVEIRQGPAGPMLLFAHDGLTTEVPSRAESHGTRQFVRLFPLLIDAIDAGGIAVADELDNSIHPHVLPEILRWFHDPVINPRRAQLWMTGHNVSLLQALGKEDILFCEKDRLGRTSVYGLQDIRGVRRDENFAGKYLDGIYGAVPHLG